MTWYLAKHRDFTFTFTSRATHTLITFEFSCILLPRLLQVTGTSPFQAHDQGSELPDLRYINQCVAGYALKPVLLATQPLLVYF
jgi:hypothetical protein